MAAAQQDIFYLAADRSARELVEGAADQSAMEFIEGWLPNRIYFIWQLTSQPRELVEGTAAQ